MDPNAGSGGVPFARDPRFEKLGEGPVGKGAVSEVWKARDLDPDPFVPGGLVAVKLPSTSAGADDHTRLRREGGEDRRFDHENVVRIFDLRGGPRSPFLVMEHIDGEDLKTLLKRHGRLSPERVVEVALQLCAALGCLHEAGLVHRDVKPGNLMIVGSLDGSAPILVKLIDLGISVASGDSEYETAGTQPYMAPEVEAHEEATEASDVYGAGVVLYELATGQRLSPLSSAERSVGRRLEAVAPPHELNPAVPEWLSSVIMRAIEVEPGARYPTVAKMRRDLELGAFADAEDPTTVIAAEEAETLTEVLGRKPAKPLAFRLLDALPPWMQERLPPDREQDPPQHWYLFFLALTASLVILLVVFLPILMRVVVTLCGLPSWLLTVIVLLGGGLTWLLREEARREATGRVLRVTGQALWRALRVAGGAGRRVFLAAAREARLLVAGGWRWASNLSWPEPPAPLTEGSGARYHGPERSGPPPRPGRSFARPGERGRSWGTAGRAWLVAFLRDAGSQLGETRAAARAWVPWLGRRVYTVVLLALVVCLALWLAPALQSRVGQQPAGHRAVLTAVPAAVWILFALIGVRVLSVSRARPRRLLGRGLVFLVLLAALGLAMPSFSSWLEPRFWPEDQAQGAATETTRTATPPSAVSHRNPRKVARRESHRLATQVRRVESDWMQLLRSLRRAGWEFGGSTKAAVREGADALVSQLSGWRSLSHYEAAREAARHWSKSMERGASTLTRHDCRKFKVGPRGVTVWC